VGEAAGSTEHMPRSALTVTLAATALSSLPAALLGTLAVEIRRDLPLSPTELGLAVTAYYLGAALYAAPSGWVAERFTGVRVLRVTPLVGALVLAALGLATHAWWQLALLMLPAGLVSAQTATASNLLLARRTPSSRQGTVFGIKQAAVPLATLVAGLALPTIALTLGWRAAYLIAAGCSLVVAGLVPRPRTPQARARSRTLSPIDPVRRRSLRLMAASLGLGVTAASGVNTFLVSGSVHAGMSATVAGLIVTLAGLTAVAIRVTVGILADRRGRRHLEHVFAMMLIGALGDGLLALGQATRVGVLLGIGAVVAIGIGWGWNGLLNFAVVARHQDAPARATGLSQTGGRIGGLVGPLLLGIVIAHLGYAPAWGIAAGLLVAAALATGPNWERTTALATDP
jgi:MFS family permease